VWKKYRHRRLALVTTSFCSHHPRWESRTQPTSHLTTDLLCLSLSVRSIDTEWRVVRGVAGPSQPRQRIPQQRPHSPARDKPRRTAAVGAMLAMRRMTLHLSKPSSLNRGQAHWIIRPTTCRLVLQALDARTAAALLRPRPRTNRIRHHAARTSRLPVATRLASNAWPCVHARIRRARQRSQMPPAVRIGSPRLASSPS
jgi:hypothetical protein